MEKEVEVEMSTGLAKRWILKADLTELWSQPRAF